jgi:hypothetical protein
MPSGHVSLAMLESDLDGTRRIANTLGITTIICPHIAADLRPADAPGWRSRLRAIRSPVDHRGESPIARASESSFCMRSLSFASAPET